MEKPTEVTQKCWTQGTGTNPTTGLTFKTSIGSCLREKNIWFTCKGPRGQENIIKDHTNQVEDLGPLVYHWCHFFILMWVWFFPLRIVGRWFWDQQSSLQFLSIGQSSAGKPCEWKLIRVNSLQFYCAWVMLRVPDKGPSVQVSDSPLNYVFSRMCNPLIAGHKAPDLYPKIN